MKYVTVLIIVLITQIDMYAQELKIQLASPRKPILKVSNLNSSNATDLFGYNDTRKFQLISLHRSGMGEQETVTMLISNNGRKMGGGRTVYFPIYHIDTDNANKSVKEILEDGVREIPIDAR